VGLVVIRIALEVGLHSLGHQRAVLLHVRIHGGDAPFAELVVLGRGLAVELDVSR
jgi:hypothetical protein